MTSVAGENGGPTIEQDEACRLLKCSVATLHQALADGTLPGLKMGKEWVIPRDAFVLTINKLAQDEALGRRNAAIIGKTEAAPKLPQKRRPGRPRKPDPLLGY